MGNENVKTSVLVEAIDLSEAALDADHKIIRNVVLLRAGMSANRRFYTEDAVRESVKVFESSKAYADHPSNSERKDRPERSLRDLTGWYENVRCVDGKLMADRHFLDTQAGRDVWAVAQPIIEKRAPASLAGLSINAVGAGKMKKYDDGEALEVTQITRALSVDDVSSPAAGGGYTLTASSGDEILTGIFEALSYEEWLEARPDLTERFKRDNKRVRQDESAKQTLADLKTATDQITTLKSELKEATDEVTRLTIERDAALAEAQSKARELALVEMLNKSQLPKTYVDDLRQRLPKEPTEQWKDIIETERKKAASAGKGRVNVSGAGQQIGTQVIAPVKPDPLVEARRRIASVQSPEELQKVLESLR